MFALLTALVLTVSTGEPGALDVVTDGVDSDANGNSSLSVSTTEFGNPNQETFDPPPEDPPPEDPPPEDPEEPPLTGGPPEITVFSTLVTPGSTLSVEGDTIDVDSTVVTVRISWLDVEYEVGVDSSGHFWWQIGLWPGDEGFITAVAIDSTGLESEPVEDLILPF